MMEFIALFGSTAATWPLGARAQQPAMPVIGYLDTSARDARIAEIDALHRGLGDIGFIEGQNVSIEYRFCNGEYDQAPVLAADLVQRQASALLVTADSFYIGQAEKLTALAKQYTLPTMYFQRQMVLAGGLASYGTSLTEVFRQVGSYAGQILKGVKPADLPVTQSTKFEFVINLKTAKTMALDIAPTLSARADEVIE
jgi:putative ABC transport system substrate-binding protein